MTRCIAIPRDKSKISCKLIPLLPLIQSKSSDVTFISTSLDVTNMSPPRRMEPSVLSKNAGNGAAIFLQYIDMSDQSDRLLKFFIRTA